MWGLHATAPVSIIIYIAQKYVYFVNCAAAAGEKPVRNKLQICRIRACVVKPSHQEPYEYTRLAQRFVCSATHVWHIYTDIIMIMIIWWRDSCVYMAESYGSSSSRQAKQHGAWIPSPRSPPWHVALIYYPLDYTTKNQEAFSYVVCVCLYKWRLLLLLLLLLPLPMHVTYCDTA